MSKEYSNISKKILLLQMEGPDKNQEAVDSVPLSPTVMLLKFDYIFSIRTMKTVSLI